MKEITAKSAKGFAKHAKRIDLTENDLARVTLVPLQQNDLRDLLQITGWNEYPGLALSRLLPRPRAGCAPLLYEQLVGGASVWADEEQKKKCAGKGCLEIS